MAKIKFCSCTAEVTEKKTSDAYIDSGKTYHFFHLRSFSVDYRTIDDETILGAADITKIVGKGTIILPICTGIIVETYHVPQFSSNVVSVRFL